MFDIEYWSLEQAKLGKAAEKPLARQIAVVTGAGSGIGAATAAAFRAQGAEVAVLDLNADAAKTVAEKTGGVAVQCDVTSYQQQQAMVEQTLKAFGRIDVAFANAGVGATASGTEHGDPENWRDMILTNLYAVVLTAKVCIPEIKKNRGHFLITSSRAGRATLKGSIYGATKWGVTGYGYNLREELAGSGARVTVLEPGMVDTPFFDTPKPKALRPDDVARAVMYAVSQPDHVDVSELLVIPVAKPD